MSSAGPILVVDDFHSMCRIMVMMLQRMGMTDVDQATDGQAALRLVNDKKYRLIISDCEMRPMTGPQFVKALREQAATAHLPVILVTAGRAHDDAAFLSGANGLLRKPFTVSALKAKIDEVLSLIDGAAARRASNQAVDSMRLRVDQHRPQAPASSREG